MRAADYVSTSRGAVVYLQWQRVRVRQVRMHCPTAQSLQLLRQVNLRKVKRLRNLGLSTRGLRGIERHGSQARQAWIRRVPALNRAVSRSIFVVGLRRIRACGGWMHQHQKDYPELRMIALSNE